MEGYLGETEQDIHKTEYAMFSKHDWILMWVERYGGIDGADHKDWLLDQIAQITLGTPVIMSVAEWDNGFKEDRFNLGEPSKEYQKWVLKVSGGIIENYNTGTAP